ncbi:acetyltransferase [Streptomyces abyssalis]|uniref:Acetyltransferase n=1 Tax=Streptomyces abyssalis TaxID=933944 RepID=A0A1E7JU36_9ACTN|nr:arylamine N-acetyltransferase [Streptomyces abyssalis]OEU88881.1 acetyltransferase [Streptomyces abyssalis]OEU93461.1 acetyltransferase [Streptomyces abyssalis]OEV05429.1 acetyltransferase [Streptomyces nanshensis]
MNDLRIDSSRAGQYLARIGAQRPVTADADVLRDLHRRHLLSVPFENLSVHLGEDIVLEAEALTGKVATDRRGGFCYELNGAFAALLAALGFPVTLLAARVFGEDGPGPLFDHLALRVETPQPWLVDVGFGRHSEYPLRLDRRGEQADPGGVFRVSETPQGDLDVHRDGVPQYRLEQRPRALADFEMGCWWNSTSPKSHFTRSLVCSLLTETGRITLSGRTLTVTGAGGRHEEELPEEAVPAAYREHFGIVLDRAPVVECGTGS